MKNSTKGAVAAAAAGVLLLGGAGSLAYWQAEVSAPGGTISSGTLSLTPAATPCTDWALDTAGGAATYTAGDPIVPGDTLTEVCTYTIAASGSHLSATLAVATPEFSGTANALSTVLAANSTATYTVDGVDSQATITSADNAKSLVATVTVEFPYGGPVSTPDPATDADNTTQGLSATLDAVTISATQTHS
jgi:alternate signal-mediated exported protein